MNRPKVFLTGGDDIGWALDEDLALTRRAIAPLVHFVDLSDAEIIHCAWWEGLMLWPEERFRGKRVICNVPGEPFRYFAIPAHRHVLPLVGLWITRTTQAHRQMEGIGMRTRMVPYVIDVKTFKPMDDLDPALADLKARWGIPGDTYLIGNFMRDTEGSDVASPKLVKGPDVFLEILLGLRRRRVPYHAVLAGPRRQWLLGRLGEEGVPHTFIGHHVQRDDIQDNMLPRTTLATLYNLLDLYVVSSRSEGGPHALLEACASRCKVISTPVGVAPDLLESGCLYSCPPDAVDLIAEDVANNALGCHVEAQYQRVMAQNVPESATPLYQQIFEQLEELPVYPGSKGSDGARVTPAPRPKKLDTEITVGLWHTFFKPPYGGGNQFMLAMKKALLRRGVGVRENEICDDVDVYLLNSIHFDVERFQEIARTRGIKVVHRIDGPIFLIRGFDREKDELCYKLNSELASATVIQSAWTLQRIFDMGYKPVSPVIIHNAVDSAIFHSRGRVPFHRGRKVRLISTSWSNNPRKGGPTYKWIDENLDWDRFEYTFVGNASESFDRVRHVPPVPSVELAAMLRDHDIYITASRNDPCSNALIEALACGLPALYVNDGGHPELVGQGGLPFDHPQEITSQLEKLLADYESFQRLIVVPDMDNVAEKYLSLIRDII